jgi:hypothetical protein
MNLHNGVIYFLDSSHWEESKWDRKIILKIFDIYGEADMLISGYA